MSKEFEEMNKEFREWFNSTRIVLNEKNEIIDDK